MKVILLENLRTFGSIGDIIDVKRGYARNFLLANKKALYASKQNIEEVNNIKSDLGKKEQERKKEAKQIAEKIENKKYSIKKLSTENKELYGSVKPTEISKLILEVEKLNIKPSAIQLANEIKSLGVFKAKIDLHSEVQTEISIEVVAAETIE
jgi:large subunit ribosomal protein L9|tara:strand:- start:1839 stop:2297 length:459 start_codon:yes stop_codon:yes gene_type:complete